MGHAQNPDDLTSSFSMNGILNPWPLLVCFSLIQTTGSCPPSCRCGEGLVTCSGMTQFPVDLPRNVTRLTITDSRIPVIRRDHFDALVDLEVLNMAHNMIQEIENGTFMDLRNLYYVSLEGNLLTSIERNTFANTNIQRLFLSDNVRLSAIDPDGFHNATVDNFYMNNCSISRESVHNVLTSLDHRLDTLDVSGNARSLELDSDLFSGCRFRSLILRDDGISDPEFLENVVTDTLDLSYNPLRNSAWNVTKYVPEVRELILESTGITSLTPTSRSDNLLVLDIARNNVSHFSGDSLQFFPNLLTLILKNNGLTMLPRDLARYVSKLTVLDVSGNRLAVLDPVTIGELSIWVLNASDNGITTLSGSLEAAFDHIRIIDLTENPFHCNCQMRWVVDWLRHLPSNRSDVAFGRCRTPAELSGIAIWRTDPDELTCKSPVVLLLAAGGRAAGEPLTVQCKGRADPAARLQLYLNGVLLDAAEPTEPLERRTTLVHHVTAFGCVDVGNYTCLATNVAGVDEEWAIIGERFAAACRDNGTITTEASDVTTDGADADDDDDVSRSSAGSWYLIPVVVVVALLVIAGVVVTSLIWRRRSRRKYNFRSAAEANRNDEVCYANSAFDRQEHASENGTSSDVTCSKNGHVTPAVLDIN